MAFNQVVKKAYAGGATAAFAAPFAAEKGSVIALNTVTAGTIVSTAGLVLAMANTFMNVEWESLTCDLQFAITTSTITAKSIWQVSNDGSNWRTLYDENGVTQSAIAAAGTGSLVTTNAAQMLRHNPAYPYIRIAILVGVVTGGAGDNVTAAYNWRMRWAAA